MAAFQHVFLNEDRTGGGVHKVLSRGSSIWSESPEYKELPGREGGGSGVLGGGNSMWEGTVA